MKEHECEYAIDVNIEAMVETVGVDYEIDNVLLCISQETGKEILEPHFVVDVR